MIELGSQADDAEINRTLVEYYAGCRPNHDNPTEALDCTVTRLVYEVIELALDHEATSPALLVMAGQAASLWRKAMNHEALPEEFL